MQHNDANHEKTVRCQLGTAAELIAATTLEFRLGAGAWPLRVFGVAVAGEVRVYRNRCPHLGWPLNVQADRFLSADAEFIVCRGHGAVFDRATGRCVGGPCCGQALTRYAARVLADGTIEAFIPVRDLELGPARG